MAQPLEQLFPASPRKAHAHELFAKLPRSYDEMGWLLSFGEDRRWRRTMVAQIEASPSDRILDVATGTGLVVAELVRRYGCSVVGVDQSEDMLGRARRRSSADPRLAARRAREGEAERLPFGDGEFDRLTFTYLCATSTIRRSTLRELARVVKPGGAIASVEFCVPRRRGCARALAPLHAVRDCRPSAAWSREVGIEVGRFLGAQHRRASTAATRSRRQCELWQRAGIERDRGAADEPRWRAS